MMAAPICPRCSREAHGWPLERGDRCSPRSWAYCIREPEAIRPRCVCAHHSDGSVTTSVCPQHADQDPCYRMAMVTGTRRKGSIVRGVCTSCGWSR